MTKPNGEGYVDGIPGQSGPYYLTYPHYVLLHPGPEIRRRHPNSCCTLGPASTVIIGALVLISLVGFAVWPTKPDVDVRKITLEDISFHTNDEKKSIIPSVTLDLSLELLLKITNKNFFGVDYDNVVVHFSYRGDELGKVRSQGGHIPARSDALAVALLDLKGTKLLKHVSDLIVDLANNKVPIETTTIFSGSVQILMFRPYVEVSVYCKMLLDPAEKVVISKDCSLML